MAKCNSKMPTDLKIAVVKIMQRGQIEVADY